VLQCVRFVLLQGRLADFRLYVLLAPHPAGRSLRVEPLAPAVVHWSTDGWRTVHDTPARDTTLGVHIVDLETMALRVDDAVEMTFYWPGVDRWEGADFVICVE
jgi:glucoamylase